MNLPGRFLIIFFLFISLSVNIKAQQEPPFLKYKTDKWVSEQLGKMTLEEKIAQLMTISVYPEQGEISKNKTIEQIELYKPGGILVMQGAPVESANRKCRFWLLLMANGACRCGLTV
jgi:hypothetical protein